MEGKRACIFSKEQKKSALQYLVFLEEKSSGKIKGRDCADRQSQQVYSTKEETLSLLLPTVSIFFVIKGSTIDGCIPYNQANKLRCGYS